MNDESFVRLPLWAEAVLFVLAVIGVLLLLNLLVGCAARRQIRVEPPAFSLVVPNGCIEEIRKGTDTYCRGRDLEHLHCYKIKLVKKVGCEHLDVNPNPEHTPQ